MSLDPRLVAILVDPVDHGHLLYVAAADVLLNPRTHQAYEVRNDIAVMMPDEARVVTPEELNAYVALGAVETAR